MARRKRRIERRLDKADNRGCSRPIFTATNIRYEVADRARGIGCGGIGAMHLLVKHLGLDEAIDRRLHLLKLHLPYHESDHVLTIAYNILRGGDCLEDLELCRQDEVFLDALGARRTPDPTTAGDFCRRFTPASVNLLQDIYDEVRMKVWRKQPKEFLAQAHIDMDGTLVPTTGECKQGMDIAYDGTWGYQTLVVSLANTGEVLRVLNRPGNRPSHEGAAAEVDKAIATCFGGGFRRVLLRGDTDFSQTKHLDRWDDDGRIQFIFGMDVTAERQVLADDLPASAWKPLVRPPRYEVKTTPRQRPENVKEQIVHERGFKNIRQVSEEVAKFDYRPVACRKTYRMVVVRKNLLVDDGQGKLFDDYRYFFYLTNLRADAAEDIVFSANDRCNQENLNAQLKGGIRALHAPVDNLVSNWAYMVMASLAWNLKAWWALSLPEGPGRWAAKHRAEKLTVLRMEFKTFANAFLRVPAQIIRTGRRIVYRLLSWNPWQHVFFRLVGQLRC